MRRLGAMVLFAVLAVGCSCGGESMECDCCGTSVVVSPGEACGTDICEPYCADAGMDLPDAEPPDASIVCDCCGTPVRVAVGEGCRLGACDRYCGGDAGGVDAGPLATSACPTSLPSEGTSCARTGVCGYMQCSGFGVGRARCVSGRFVVATEPCAPIDCRGMSCAVGQFCQINVGGAVIPFCTTPPDGPMTCDSICGGACTDIIGEASDPPISFTCNVCTDPPCA